MRQTGRVAKYNEEERRKIAEEYFTTDKSRGEIAEKFSISVATVSKYAKEFREEFCSDKT